MKQHIRPEAICWRDFCRLLTIGLHDKQIQLKVTQINLKSPDNLFWSWRHHETFKPSKFADCYICGYLQVKNQQTGKARICKSCKFTTRVLFTKHTNTIFSTTHLKQLSCSNAPWRLQKSSEWHRAGRSNHILFRLLLWPYPFWGSEAAIARNLLAISVKLGLCEGSVAQHCSINDLHSASQDSGTGGRSVSFRIPPVERTHIWAISCQSMHIMVLVPTFAVKILW